MGRAITVEVTQHDIDWAIRNDSTACVVTRAIARTLPRATRIEVDTQTIRYTDADSGQRLAFLTPFMVQQYVIDYDAGDDIDPFRFQLRNPIMLRRRVVAATADEISEAKRKKAKIASRAKQTAKRKPKPKADDTGDDDQPDPGKIIASYPDGTVRTQGREAPRKVFRKTKRRTYGHRVLRINQPPKPTDD